MTKENDFHHREHNNVDLDHHSLKQRIVYIFLEKSGRDTYSNIFYATVILIYFKVRPKYT